MAGSRREFLRRSAGGGVVLGLAGGAWADGPADGPRLIIRNARPLDAETPVSAFDRWATPNDLFFVRSHFGPPAVGLSPWKLNVGGLVERPVGLSLDDLAKYEPITVPAVLQCSGNGRAFYRPRIPGVGWERGAVGNAEWAGVRLKDVLEKAGIKTGAGHVHLLAADGPPSPKTPAYLRSLPLERALDPTTVLATRMNGEPLPLLHGGPVRVVVPSWTGNHWIKWLRGITVAADEAPGFYQQTGYRIPRVPAPPGADLKPADLVPVTVMNVKSLVAWPGDGERLKAGRQFVRGVAWTGPGRVTGVEVAIDDGPWRAATLEGPDVAGSWRLWKYDWDVSRPGRYALRVRATDSQGATQPDATPWNRSGYLWNGIERVTCEVV